MGSGAVKDGGRRWRSGTVLHWRGDDDVSGVLDDGGRWRHIGIVTSGAPRWVRSAVGGDDRWRMLGGGDELHRHRVGGLMRAGGFWIRANELLRDRLGFRLRFRSGSLVLGVLVTAL